MTQALVPEDLRLLIMAFLGHGSCTSPFTTKTGQESCKRWYSGLPRCQNFFSYLHCILALPPLEEDQSQLSSLFACFSVYMRDFQGMGSNHNLKFNHTLFSSGNKCLLEIRSSRPTVSRDRDISRRLASHLFKALSLNWCFSCTFKKPFNSSSRPVYFE